MTFDSTFQAKDTRGTTNYCALTRRKWCRKIEIETNSKCNQPLYADAIGKAIKYSTNDVDATEGPIKYSAHNHNVIANPANYHIRRHRGDSYLSKIKRGKKGTIKGHSYAICRMHMHDHEHENAII